jgi:ABC-type transport system involved in cytochrome c biogenesis permease component
VLAEHGVAASPRSDLLHPVLVLPLNVPVIVNLAACRLHGQLGAVHHISDARLRILTVFLLNWLVILHFTLKISKVLPKSLILKS